MLAEVQDSPDFRRVRDLPRRTWTPESAAELARDLTAALKTDGGTRTLRPIQAVALKEARECRGGFFPIRIGGGKSLLSFLLPVVLNADRPLLIIPAALREKTVRELHEWKEHFHLQWRVRIESYEALSRVSGAKTLDDYAPDVVIADECHRLKNRSAACTQRLKRYLAGRGHDAAFVAMSGSVTKRSIRDFAHIARWALGAGAPVPGDYHALQEWSQALDVNVRGDRRLGFGVLGSRQWYRDRLVETPGVVATQEGPLPIELVLRSHAPEIPPEVEDAYATLRRTWCTPDGWEIEDPPAMWRHARELSTGFYSVWDPRPPREWSEKRSAYLSGVRKILQTNRRDLDTELQVRGAIDDGHYPALESALEEWRAIAPSFEPNPVPVWLSDSTLDWIAAWAKRQPSPAILWTERPAVGERLERLHGIRYYGADSDPIENATGTTVCASLAAHGTGRNLQAWHRMLYIDVPPNGSRFEQSLGRMHRDGQTACAVHADMVFGCVEDVEAFWRSVRDSAYAEEITGQAQKLTHADIEDVESVDEAKGRKGPQWKK